MRLGWPSASNPHHLSVLASSTNQKCKADWHVTTPIEGELAIADRSTNSPFRNNAEFNWMTAFLSTSKLARIPADLSGFQSLEPSTELEDWRDARYIIDPEGVHYCDYRLNWMIGEMLAISNHVRTMRLLSRSWPSVDALLDSHSHVNRKGCAVLTIWCLVDVWCRPSLCSRWRVDLVPYLLILVFQVHFLVSART
jgi:hypothetical protein